MKLRKGLIIDYCLTIGGFALAMYSIYDLRQFWAICGFALSFGDIVRVLHRKGRK